jgi:tetratricopeptide (TPR) repeat protein
MQGVAGRNVTATETYVTLPTYEPAEPCRHPMFFERRVYQGSSGRVYPLPLVERIAETPTLRRWRAVCLENEHLEVMILPEIGGRIHGLRDKRTGFDLIYRQHVIKPALVGLAGPWISGGIEFNWPQHHRPATFTPAECRVENEPDGAAVAWLTDLDPLSGMRGTHGVRLRPGSAALEIEAVVHNPTEVTRRFLWWMNIGIEVHERYESLFPDDVAWVADHAKRGVASFPRVSDRYYGVDYGGRGKSGVPDDEQPAQYRPTGDYPPDDLRWYANIPVPTSYMCIGSRHDHFGGYDHAAGSGLLHVASRHVAPGKKQWTWGNHEFGYAWDRLLTDPDEHGRHRPYIELMAGVYTDNQPDFSFLLPGETKRFSQYLLPIHDLPRPDQASTEAVLQLDTDGTTATARVATTRSLVGTLRLTRGDAVVGETPVMLEPTVTQVHDWSTEAARDELTLTLLENGRRVLTLEPPAEPSDEPLTPAREPAAPDKIPTADKLFFTGVHLDQYNHATRDPADYWREALRRDPADARCNTMLGWWHHLRGEFDQAVEHFAAAVGRETTLNPNPRDGEAHYGLGLASWRIGRTNAAIDALHKAAWNRQWVGPACFKLAQLIAAAGDQVEARRLIRQCLLAEPAHPAALRLRALLHGEPMPLADGNDNRSRTAAAYDLLNAGFTREAADVLADEPQDEDRLPMWHLLRGRIAEVAGESAESHLDAAAACAADRCFPSGLDDLATLQWAMLRRPDDAATHRMLGNLLFDVRRREEALVQWETATVLNPQDAAAWRNVGLARFNLRGDAAGAEAAYRRAVAAAPDDGRLFYEYDQLRKRLGHEPADRLAALQARPDLVAARDDLSLELATLHNLVGDHEAALAVLGRRAFQPWEGGEGSLLKQHETAHEALGVAAEDSAVAADHFRAALHCPPNLGEARHLLANVAPLHYRLGLATGDDALLRRAANFRGDFQDMQVRPFSEATYFSALAMRQLGQADEADTLLRSLLDHAEKLEHEPATIDYFATSLPTMLLFEDDLQRRQTVHAKLMQAQAHAGLGNVAHAATLLDDAAALDPNHLGIQTFRRELTQAPES